MVKINTNKNIKINNPKLRFSGFSGEWEGKKLGDLFDFISTNSYPRSQLNYKMGDTKNIHYGDIHTKFKLGFDIENEEVPYINKEIDKFKINKESYCQEGDLVIADASEDYQDVGKTIELINLKNQKIVAGLHTFLLRKKDQNNPVKGFPGYLMKTDVVREQIMKSATGISVLGISKGSLTKVVFNVPNTLEQQKIASFLGTVDNWIENLRAQKRSFESYKKGMMQKIFAQEIRFKDDNGKEFPKWEEKKLGEYIVLSSTRNKNNKYNLVLSVNNQKGFIAQSEQFENHRIASTDVSNYKIVERGDFAYNPSRINVGSIACLKIFEIGIVSPMYIVFKLLKGLNAEFFENYITTHRFNYLVKIWCSGSVRDSLNFEDLENFKVKYPILLEQQKIVDFLTSIDKLIESKQQQITRAEEWKRGLMQGLFV